MSKNKTGKGGAGRGQGRKNKYGEPTEAIRVPISLIPDLEKKMKKLEEKAKK